MTDNPPLEKQQYNQQLHGVYGEFGTGAGVQAFYLQSAIPPAELDRISLISEIQGSERWPVRDLFQRDVDNQRIMESLLPYLKEADKVKFFNPLTLTVLPMEEDGLTVLTEMPRVTEFSLERNQVNWLGLERENFYRIRWIADNPQYAVIEWNDTRSRLVAIDGQHRLSALKCFYTDAHGSSRLDFMKWRIPIVVVSFRAGKDRDEPPSVLEVVRNIFVYINTEAREVTPARQILLSDENVSAVCTQELLQRSHTNDLRPTSQRNSQRLPLLFYDWRGEETEKRQEHAPAAAKSVEEIRDWFRWHILGPEFSDRQYTALGLYPTHSLHQAFHDSKLNHIASETLRELVKGELLPAVGHLLENFHPYQSYIAALRALEKEYESDTTRSVLAYHAFYELRFGTNYAPDSIKDDAKEVLGEIKNRIGAIKEDCFGKLIQWDIGMRGVVSAFGSLRRSIGSTNWVEFSEWFTAALNRMYEEKWLDLETYTSQRKLMLHIAEDHNEGVANYRHDHVGDALGVYVELFVATYGQPWPETWPDSWKKKWPVLREDWLDNRLRNTIYRGYRRQIRPLLREQKYPQGGTELTAAVNREANVRAGRHVRRIERELDRIEESQ